MTDPTISPLRRRMIDDMTIRGYTSLVITHHPVVADDIGGEDRRKPLLDTLFVHVSLPDAR